jgi:hypothetical protein
MSCPRPPVYDVGVIMLMEPNEEGLAIQMENIRKYPEG